MTDQPMLDIRVREFVRARGDAVLRLNDPIVGLVCAGTVMTTRINGGPPKDLYRPGNSFGFLPYGMHYETRITRPVNLILIRIARRFFEHAAFETIEPGRPGYRFVHGLTDSVGVNLCYTLRALANEGRAHEWPLLTDTLATSMAVRVMQLLGAKRNKPDVPYPGGLPSNRLQRVTQYVEARIDRPMRLTELARVAALSPYHFARAFRAATGLPPMRYVWQRRVERAKLLMQGPHVPLAIIAFDCGFSSQSHFATVFKRETGMTPTEYRAKL